MIEIVQMSVDVEDVEMSVQLVKTRRNATDAVDIN